MLFYRNTNKILRYRDLFQLKTSKLCQKYSNCDNINEDLSKKYATESAPRNKPKMGPYKPYENVANLKGTIFRDTSGECVSIRRK